MIINTGTNPYRIEREKITKPKKTNKDSLYWKLQYFMLK